MGKVTWRGVREHPVRFLLSLVAVILGISFLSGTFSLSSMLSSTFDSIIDGSTVADTYVSGQPTSDQSAMGVTGETARIPISLTKTIEKAPGVKRAEAELQGPMVLVGKDGTAVTSQAPSFAVGMTQGYDTLKVTAGRPPAKAGEIAIEKNAYDLSGLKVGDTAKVILNGKVTTQKVVGELTFDSPMAGALMIGLDQGTATKLFAPDGRVTTISVYAKDGTSQEQLADSVRSVLPAGAHAQVTTGDKTRADSKEEINSQLGFVTTFLGIFAGIGLFVGGFIILNTFSMIVRQRMKEIAVLRAMGASMGQIFASVVGQAVIIGAIGSVIGIFGGLGLVSILRSVIGIDFAGSIPLTAGGVVASLVVGILMSAVFAFVPARKAAKTPPVEAMREQMSASESSLLLRGVIGGALVAVGVAGVLLSLGGGDSAGLLLGVGATCLLVGALVAAPVVAPAITRFLAWPVLWIRPLGRLARGNVARNPRRTANTASALMIGMALVGAASVLASSVQASVGGTIDKELKADLVVQGAQQEIPSGAVAAVDQVPDVARADKLYGGSLVEGVGKNAAPVGAAAATPGTLDHSLKIDMVSGSLTGLDRGQVLVLKNTAKDKGWKVGDTITLAEPALADQAPVTATIGGIFDSHALYTDVILPLSTYDKLVPANLRSVNTIFVTADPGKISQAQAGLTAAVKPYFVVSVQDGKEFADSLNAQVNGMLSVIYGLLALSIIIAVLGIVNTLALSIMERTREIGVMRAVGLGRMQLSGTIMIESVLISVFGAVTGVLLGVAVASALPKVMADEGLSTLVVPWTTCAVMLVLAAVVGVAAAVWPAIRASRLPVLDAVAEE